MLRCCLCTTGPAPTTLAHSHTMHRVSHTRRARNAANSQHSEVNRERGWRDVLVKNLSWRTCREVMMLDCKQKYELRAKIVMSRSSTAETTSYVAIGHRIITSAVAQTVPKRRNTTSSLERCSGPILRAEDFADGLRLRTVGRLPVNAGSTRSTATPCAMAAVHKRALLVAVAVTCVVLAGAHCSNMCSGHGDCFPVSKCTCYSRWQGGDCSMSTWTCDAGLANCHALC